MGKYEYYRCQTERSRLSGQRLKSCIKRCKDKICLIYEKEQNGATFVYKEDNRNWLQKHKTQLFFLLISLSIGSYFIPKFLF